MNSVETLLLSLNLDLSPGSNMWYDTLVGCWAIAAAAPCQPHAHGRTQQIHLQPFWTHTTILIFTFSAVFNKLHEMFHTLL